MNVKVSPSVISGKITPLASKSVAHRALICAYLSQSEVELLGDFRVDDITATANCLRAMGAVIESTEYGYLVRKGNVFDRCEIDAKESGSTLRFILPLCSALGINAKINGSKRLSNRPIGELLQVLKENGANFSSDSLPLEAFGKISSGTYKISGSISSQYITGLLLALSSVSGKSRIEIQGEFVSRDYVEITVDVMKSFGVEIAQLENGYVIDNISYNAPKSYRVEGDWSSACFLLCLASLCGEVTLEGLNINSRQGDKVVLKVLEEIGAKVTFDKDRVTVKKGELRPIEFDAQNYPDFVPVLSCVLGCAKGVSKIYNVERLRDKESDRLSGTIELLKAFGIKAEYDGKAIIIYGGQPKGCVYNSPNDHRMAMSASVLACVATGESQIINAECVNKSYPCFFEHLKKIGGKVDV